MNVQQEVEIWTDGACEPNPGVGGWGAVIHNPRTGFRKEIYGGPFEDVTNNQMEMLAICEGLELLRKIGPVPVNVMSDSKYCINGITEWIHGWRKKGWVTAAGKPVLNAGLWGRMDDARKRFPIVRFTWVKGHVGNELNERADYLACAARRREEIA